MNVFAFCYSLISLIMILVCLIVFNVIQREYKSRAKSMFTLLLIAIGLRVLGNFIQAIFTSLDNEILATIGIYLGMLSSVFIFFFMALFLHLILGEHEFKSPTIYLAIALVFGTFVYTVNPNTYSVIYNYNLGAFVGSGDIIHSILLFLSSLVVNLTFLVFLIKQYEIVERKYYASVTFMIIGDIFMGFIVLIFYFLRYLFIPIYSLLHVENISLGFGIIFLTIGYILGGKAALMGSSKIYYVSIFFKCGLNMYHGRYSGTNELDEQLLSALATAVTSFGNLVMGEDVFPKEISFKDFAIVLYRYEDVIGFISCKYPSRQLRFGLKNIVTGYKEEMTKDEITKLIELNLPIGKPVSIK